MFLVQIIEIIKSITSITILASVIMFLRFKRLVNKVIYINVFSRYIFTNMLTKRFYENR